MRRPKLDTMLIGVHIFTLLLSVKILAAAEPAAPLKKDSYPVQNPLEANLGPNHESSQIVRYVRNAADDYEEYEEQTEGDHLKPGRREKGQKKKVKERSEATRIGRGAEIENSLLFCFKVCNSLIFEVYQLLGGNVCNCDK